MTIVYNVPLCGQFKHLLMRRSNFLRILMTRINWYYELAVIIFDIIMFFVHLEVWYILKPHSAIHFGPVEMLIILFNCMQLIFVIYKVESNMVNSYLIFIMRHQIYLYKRFLFLKNLVWNSFFSYVCWTGSEFFLFKYLLEFKKIFWSLFSWNYLF